MIIRAYTLDDIAPHMEQLVKINIECFSEFPWLSCMDSKKVLNMLKRHISYPGQISLLCFTKDILVGATINFPVIFNPVLTNFIEKNIWEKTICLSGTFVKPNYQSFGFGKNLHEERLRLAKEEGYEYAIHRTNPDSLMYAMIKKTGFEPIGECKVRLPRMIGGKIKNLPDTRVVSLKKL